MECLRHDLKSSANRIPSLFTFHSSLFTIHYLPIGEGIKKFPSPEQNQGWDTKYSTVPPWLRLAPSLIDAVTGVTGRAFPPGSSESGIADRRGSKPSHQMGLSLRFLRTAHVFRHSFLRIECTTKSAACQCRERAFCRSKVTIWYQILSKWFPIIIRM